MEFSRHWTVSLALSNRGGYHIQARTMDQLSSFATVVNDLSQVFRGKTPDGKADTFVLAQDHPHVTMNVVGQITWVGTWDEEKK